MASVQELRQKYGLLLPHLDERTRRLLVAADAMEAGHGGVAKVAGASGLSRQTIYRGLEELVAMPAPPKRARRAGGGRKSIEMTDPAISAALEALVDPLTRGDPESPLKWCSKSCDKLATELTARAHPVSGGTVRRLLRELDYRLHAPVKTEEGSSHPDRDAQFLHINAMARIFMADGQPVISVDCKKKELIGEFKNGGREYRPVGLPDEVNAYDFPELAEGKGLPYGVYDVQANQGWVSVGTDHDTAAFAVATIQRWWESMGRAVYPSATRLLICADGGGSNGARCRLWKRGVQQLANTCNLAISVCHYPPGTSKWNKIEHRLFSHISMNWRGKPLVSHDVMVELIRHTTTKKGLKVEAALDKNSYPTGIKVTDGELATVQLTRDDFHGEWNYTITPQT